MVAADLGKDRRGQAMPSRRQRGGAHAAAKTSRFRRKSASAVPASAHAALTTAAGHWTLTTAALAEAVALALACIGRRRTGARPTPGPCRGQQ